MKNFQLSLLFEINGISSASSLVYNDEFLYIISDSSTYLYKYHMPEDKLYKIALVKNAQENIPKKQKLDFESISLKGNDLLILGSGSTANRNLFLKYDIITENIVEKSFADLYKKIKEETGIKDDEFNIEGLMATNKTMYFLQRGNGSNSKNGIIYSNITEINSKFKFVPIELPKIKNIETTFTDAILIDNTIYFLATAEDTNSTYDDGEILGGIIGSINLETMTVNFTEKITDDKKLEGITLFKQTDDQIEFLLCEDNDTEELISNIYLLKMKRE